jgi:hypothetical protein
MAYLDEPPQTPSQHIVKIDGLIGRVVSWANVKVMSEQLNNGASTSSKVRSSPAY